MATQYQVQLGDKGRLVIPAEIRQAMGLEAGSTVFLSYENDQLKMETRRARIRRAQERARKYIPAGILLSEELSAERREEARRELE